MFVNFAERLKQKPTINEGVILSNSKVKILSTDTWQHFDSDSKRWIGTIEIRVKQIQ